MTEKTKKEDPFGYDVVDEAEVGGKYLRFRKGDKGRVIHIRIASKPKYVNQHWITDTEGREVPANCDGEKCSYCGDDVPVKERVKKTPKFGWVVIDRDDGQAKVFTAPFSVARDIKGLAEDEDWGNPLLYDIKIKRTEKPGSYYKVTPVPTGKGKPLTKEEKELVEAADFNLEEELQGGMESENVGNYEGQKKVEAKSESEEGGIEEPSDLPF